MMHARRDSADRHRRPPHRGRQGALLFALLVMALAVLPHLTLAASMMRGDGSGHGGHGPAVAAMAAMQPAQSASHCRKPASSDHATPATPPCCIAGCGLIAEVPAAPALPTAIAWSKAVPPSIRLEYGLTTEPAERPPRSGRRLL